MEHDEMDISRMGRYAIDGETGKLIESKVIWDFRCTWGVDLYSYLDRLPTSLPPGQMENIYWSSFGLWPQLMTKFIFDLHKDYKYQLIPKSTVLSLAKNGIPPCLFRLHTKSMVIADRYEFPCGYMMLSPQFVPRGNGDSSTNGYIVCAVCFEDKNEIWIFDANDLAKGPLCRLHHPDLKFGFTLHTTWLRQIGSRQARYNVPVRQDYQDLIEQFPYPPEIKKKIQELFDNQVYPHFEKELKSI